MNLPVNAVYGTPKFTDMKKLLLLIVLIAISPLLSAQASGNILYNETSRWAAQAQQVAHPKAAQPNQDHMVIDINGLINVKADSYLAIFHVVQMGETAAEADSLVSARIEGFRNIMMKEGLREQDILPDMLSLVPVYEVAVTKKLFTKNYTEIPAGFEIQKNLHVHFTDAAMLDRIVTAAAINEIYDLIKVDYYVKNHRAFYDSLRMEAMAVLSDRIEQLQDLGIPVGEEWRQTSDRQGIFFPLERYVNYKPVVKTGIEAIQKRKRDEVDTITAEQRSTVYYNKVGYNGFDFVINPEIIEPAVQYTYNLQVRLFIERPKDEPKEEVVVAKPEPEVKIEVQTRYILVDQNGNVKELPYAAGRKP